MLKLQTGDLTAQCNAYIGAIATDLHEPMQETNCSFVNNSNRRGAMAHPGPPTSAPGRDGAFLQLPSLC